MGLVVISLSILGIALLWDLITQQKFSIGLRQILLIGLGLIGLLLVVVVTNERLFARFRIIWKNSYEIVKLLVWPSKADMLPADQSGGDSAHIRQIQFFAKIIAVLVICIAAIAVLSLSAPISKYRFPWNDSAIFAYIGRQILNGKILYTQIFDNKPPLIFFMNAFGLLFDRNSFWGVWVLELGSLLASSIIIFNVIKRLFGIMPAFVAIVAGVFNLVIPFQRGNLTEEYAILYQALTIYLLFSNISKGKEWLRYLLIGLCGGIAFLFKTNVIGLWIALGAFLIIRTSRKNILNLLFMLMGFLSINLLFILIFALQGNLKEYWVSAYQYNFFYSGSNFGNFGNVFLQSVNTFIHLSVFYFMCALAWGYLLIKFIHKSIVNGIKVTINDAMYSFYGILIIYYPIELFLANFTGRNFPHYYISLWAGSIILIAILIKDVVNWVLQHKLKIAYSIPAVLLAAALISPLTMVYEGYPVKTEVTVTETVQFIKENTVSSDKIYVFGGQPVVYFLSNRESPSRFFFFNHLAISKFATGPVIDGFISEFMQNPPKIIVETWGLNSPGIQKMPDGKCAYTQYPQISSLNSLYEYICSNYEVVKSGGKDNWLIYMRSG